LPADGARQALVTDFVDGLLTNMGYTTNNSNVTITDTTVGARLAVTVTVSASVSTMMAGNFSNVMPLQFQMSDSATAIDNDWMWGYAACTLPTGQKFTAPLINATGALPNDGLPAYGVSLLGMVRIR
jgi:hypothetical protein